MYWLCMIATIPLATGNKLNCFISARGMLAIVWHCMLLFCWVFYCVCFLLIFYMLINHLLKNKTKKTSGIQAFLPSKLVSFIWIGILIVKLDFLYIIGIGRN